MTVGIMLWGGNSFLWASSLFNRSDRLTATPPFGFCHPFSQGALGTYQQTVASTMNGMRPVRSKAAVDTLMMLNILIVAVQWHSSSSRPTHR